MKNEINEHDEKSEFGKGLAYNLGLFIAHQFMFEDGRKEVYKEASQKFGRDMWPETWFNGSSDHLYELQVDSAPSHLRKRLKEFGDKCLHWGHGFSEPYPTEKDVNWAIQEAKALLMELDKSNKIDVIKAEWD